MSLSWCYTLSDKLYVCIMNNEVKKAYPEKKVRHGMPGVDARKQRLAILLKTLRDRTGSSVRAMARRLNVSQTALGFWESASMFPESDNLRKLASLNDRTIIDLEAYVQGRLTLAEYLDGSAKSDYIPVQKSLKSLSYYTVDELAIIVELASKQLASRVKLVVPDDTESGSLDEYKETIQLTHEQTLRLGAIFEQSLCIYKKQGLTEKELCQKFETNMLIFNNILEREIEVEYYISTLEKIAAFCFRVVRWRYNSICTLDPTQTYKNNSSDFWKAIGGNSTLKFGS